MKWQKRGLIYRSDGTHRYSASHAMLPTPFLVNPQVVRIYFSTLDANKVGRIFYIDTDSSDLGRILDGPHYVPLEPGPENSFDSFGVNPCQVIEHGDGFALFYVGFNRAPGSPYQTFPGLYTSESARFSNGNRRPLLASPGSVSHGSYFVFKLGSTWVMYYSGGERWILANGKSYQQMAIRISQSQDGMVWPQSSEVAIPYDDDKEFALGRPWVFNRPHGFGMLYSIRSMKDLYRIGYAESEDGTRWSRKDDEAGITVSESGWDSEMVCYPATIKVGPRTYLLYCGNNNGQAGFGWAELVAAT